jgi:hypothetical protein
LNPPTRTKQLAFKLRCLLLHFVCLSRPKQLHSAMIRSHSPSSSINMFSCLQCCVSECPCVKACARGQSRLTSVAVLHFVNFRSRFVAAPLWSHSDFHCPGSFPPHFLPISCDSSSHFFPLHSFPSFFTVLLFSRAASAPAQLFDVTAFHRPRYGFSSSRPSVVTAFRRHSFSFSQLFLLTTFPRRGFSSSRLIAVKAFPRHGFSSSRLFAVMAFPRHRFSLSWLFVIMSCFLVTPFRRHGYFVIGAFPRHSFPPSYPLVFTAFRRHGFSS